MTTTTTTTTTDQIAPQLSWLFLLLGNRTEASALLSRLGADPAGQTLSAATLVGVLQKRGDPVSLENLQRSAALFKTNQRMQTLGEPQQGTPQVRLNTLAAMRSAATTYAITLSRSTPAELMPKGVSQLPPVRPANYDFGKLSLATVMRAADTFETNAQPVSNPGYAAPADPLFATWFRGLDQLGTRSLKMSEVHALVNTSALPEAKRAAVVYQPQSGVVIHEFHKMMGGFREVPGSTTWSPGMGGEGGILARITDEYDDPPDNISDMGEVMPFLTKKERERQAAPVIASNDWPKIEQQLSGGDSDAVNTQIDVLKGAGYAADPRAKQTLEPLFKVLRSTAPGSTERVAAAQAISANLKQREQSLQTLSVSGVTAELQMAQAFNRYLKLNRLNTYKPNDQVDAVAVYQLYRDMLSKGELVSKATVEGMLKSWGRPYVE